MKPVYEILMPTAVYISGITIVGTVCAGVILLALVATNPVSIGPVGVTGWFILLFMSMAAWVSLGLNFLSQKKGGRGNSAVMLTTAVRRGVLLSGIATICIGLSSLRQLTIRDVILTTILAALIEIYFRGKA